MIASQCGMLEVVQVLLRFHARVDVFDEVIEAHFAITIYNKNLSAMYKYFDLPVCVNHELLIPGNNLSRIVKEGGRDSYVKRMGDCSPYLLGVKKAWFGTSWCV